MALRSPHHEHPHPYPLSYTHHEQQTSESYNANQDEIRTGTVCESSVLSVEPYTRIALLEKDLEHCQLGKSKAEIVIQYLAKMQVKVPVYADDDAGQSSMLRQQLAQTEKDKEALTAKLESAMEIIITIFSSRSITSEVHPIPQKKTDDYSTDPANTEDLIDLADNSADTDSTLISQREDSVAEGLDDVSSEDENSLTHSLSIKPSQTIDIPDIPYKVRFEDSKGDNYQAAKVLKEALKDGHARSNSKFSTPSPDQRSETSAEPRSDSSFKEYATASDEPHSLSTSFSTVTDTYVSEPHFPPEKTSVRTSVDAQMLALQNWDSFKYAPPNYRPYHAQQDSQPMQAKPAASRYKLDDTRYITVRLPKPKGPEPFLDKFQTFSSEERRQRSIAIHQREVLTDGPHSLKFPHLFRYGLRFQPDASERDIYRTVVINGLSLETKLGQVLQKIRGGMLIDAQLLDTSKLLGSNSALLVFFQENGALSYEEYTKTHPIKINNHNVKVNVVATPTYPMSPRLRNCIENLRHTRCLEVHHFPRQISAARLRFDLRVSNAVPMDKIEHMKLRDDRVLELRFSSVDHAGYAFGQLTRLKEYKGCKVCYVADPCAQPVDSLNEAYDGTEGSFNDVKLAASIILSGEFDSISEDERDGCTIDPCCNDGVIPEL